ncbi:MAG: electron transporter [Pseudonocardiales bacterium]|nr:MAG: electron transporter [Pseudonocardiales bacterium]
MGLRRVLVAVAILGVGLLVAALAWFQPWKLWVDHHVNDALPAVALAPASTAVHGAPPAGPAGTSPSTGTAPAARLLSRGMLISQEHATHGTVSVVRQPGGARVLAIAHLDTSNGPDLHVWLTDAPVRRGSDGWHVFDDGEHISLGTLKGNVGNQVYSIPSNVDLSRLTSVTIWCARFQVSFGAAQLVPITAN